MELFIKETWLVILTAFVGLIAYWAKSTKDSLEKNDARIEADIKNDHSKLDLRLTNVESGINDNKIMLTEIKGDVKLLSSSIGFYRKEKHDLDNDNAALRGTLSECTEALKISERIMQLAEKK